MNPYSSERSQSLEDPLTYGAGVAVARLRALRERQRAVDELLAAAARLIGGLLAGAWAALERSRQRRLMLRDLRALDDHLLADIGLSRPLLGVIASDLSHSRPSGGRPDGRAGRCGGREAAGRRGGSRRLTTCPAS